MKEETLVNEKQDSIEVSRTAKGIYSWKIKKYYNSSTIKNPSLVVDVMKALDEYIRKKFPDEAN